jgi:hypothetical protein
LDIEVARRLETRTQGEIGPALEDRREIVAMVVTNRYPSGYWEDRRYNLFGGI